MYSYNNSFVDKFKHNIRSSGVEKQNQPPSSIGSINDNSAQGVMELSNVTPDYGVSVPMGYTKTGVEKLVNGQEIHCYRLKNGLKVYIAPKESAKTVLNTYVNTGALNEKDEERGISHFCEHMAFNGTKGTDGYMKLGKGDVFRLVYEMGGNTNASTNYAETNYTISIPQFNKGDFEKIVKMQSSMMSNLEMSEEMTEKEHGPVTSEINMYADMPESVATNAAIKNLYNINTTSDDVVAGRVDNILNINSQKVMDYYKNNYYPSNMTTVVTGDVNPDEAIEIIAKNFKGENPISADRRLEKLTPTQKTVRKDIFSPKAVATTGVVCFNGPANNDTKENIAIEAVNHYLFNKKNSVSEKSLDKYNVSVSAAKDKLRTEPGDGTLLSLTYNATEDTSEIALKSIFSNIQNFKTPDEEEMDIIKTALKMKYEQTFDDTEGLNYLIGQNALNNNLGGCTEAINAIDELKPEDLTNAVRKYYDTSKASVAIIHPQTANYDTLNREYNAAKSINFTGHSVDSAVMDKPREPLKLDKILTYKLNNNCKVAISKTNNDIATFSANVTNPVPANTKPGVAEVLADIVRRGNDNIVEIVDKNNITAYAGGSNNNIYYEAQLPVKNIAVSMDIMKKSLFNPEITQENLDKAKKQIKSDLLTTPPSSFDNIKNSLFPNSPRGYSNKDILNNIDNVTIEDVKGLHKYITDNGGFTYSASVPLDKYPNVKTIIDTSLNQVAPLKDVVPREFNDYIPVEKTKVITDESNTAQADVIQAYKFPMKHDPKSQVTYALLNNILSKGDDSGLFNNLREKEKLAYSVSSDIIRTPYKSGVLLCNILTTTDSDDLKKYDNVKRSIEGFNRQINVIKSGEFTDNEFETAKVAIKRELLVAAESPADKVTMLSNGMNSVNGISELNDQFKAIDEITKEDIVNIANEIFSNKPLYSVKASKDTIESNKEFFKQLEN